MFILLLLTTQELNCVYLCVSSLNFFTAAWYSTPLTFLKPDYTVIIVIIVLFGRFTSLILSHGNVTISTNLNTSSQTTQTSTEMSFAYWTHDQEYDSEADDTYYI